METFAANLAAAEARRETMQGRDFLVVPVTLIVPGVLEGSDGPLFYPPEECAASQDVWNGVPVVIWHPMAEDPEDGELKPVSARTPDVMAASCVGWLFNALWDPAAGPFGTGALVAEAWIDLALLKEIDALLDPAIRVLPRLEAGEPVPVSTGLFKKEDKAEGVFVTSSGEERPYRAVARSYRADHLAVLPDMEGACSVKDGCGLLMNARGPGAVKEGDAVKSKLVNWLVANCDCWKDGKGTPALNAMTVEQLKILKNNAVAAKLVANVRAGRKTAADLVDNADGDGEGGGEPSGPAVADMAELFGIATNPAEQPVQFVKELKAAVAEWLKQLGGDEPAPAPEPEPDPADAMNADDDGDDDRPAANRGGKKGAKPAANRGKPAAGGPKTRKQWLAEMPAEMVDPWNDFIESAAELREDLLDQVVNAQASNDAARKVLRKQLSRTPLKELRQIADGLQGSGGSGARDPYSGGGRPRFDGASGIAANTRTGRRASRPAVNADDLEDLPLPSLYDGKPGRDDGDDDDGLDIDVA